MAATATFPSAANNGSQTFVNSDGTTAKAVYTAGTSGGRLNALNAASNDTSSHDVQVWLNLGGSDVLIATVSVAAGAGNTSGVAQTNILASLGSVLDPAGYWILKASAVVKLSMVVAVTAAKTVYAVGIGSDF